MLKDNLKIKLVTILAIIAFLWLMAYSPALWIANKAFPQIPRFDFIPTPKSPWDYVFSVLLALLLMLFMFKPKKYIGLSIVMLYFYLAMVDQNRLQPYFYQSILTVLIVSFYRKSRKNTTIILHCLMFVFIATYFWSGIHKFNPNFYYIWDRSFAKPDRFGFVNEQIRVIFVRLMPFVETFLGLFLIFNKTRKLAVFGIVVMHICIVGSLFYVGYGFNVVPWNLQNIISVIILFWSYKTTKEFAIINQFYNYKKAIILVITFALPTSNLFGFWDHLLSYSFFSAKLKYYYIEINEEKLLPKLPDNIKYYVFDWEGKKIINLNDWCGDVNKVLIYPEERVALKTEKYLKSFANNPNDKDLTKMVEYIQLKK